MNSRIVPAVVVLITVLMTSAVTVQAQRAGFSAGIAPPSAPAAPLPAINPPVQPFISAPVQPMGRFGTTPPITPPIITTTYSPVYSNFPSPAVAVGGLHLQHPSSFYGGAGVTVIVPNGTVINNTTVIIQPQGQFTAGGPIAAKTFNPVPGFQPPAPGTSRADVIQQLGSPLTSTITQRDETMYFTGGVTVVLQDGKVIAPRRPN